MHPLLTGEAVFDTAFLTNIKRYERCRILQTLGSVIKSSRRPPLTHVHKGERPKWAQNNMKIHFSKVIFTKEGRVDFDGPDGPPKEWILDHQKAPITKRRQQDGGGIMILAGIVGSKLTGPFKEDDGGKFTSETYSKFLSNPFFQMVQKPKTIVKSKICVYI